MTESEEKGSEGRQSAWREILDSVDTPIKFLALSLLAVESIAIWLAVHLDGWPRLVLAAVSIVAVVVVVIVASLLRPDMLRERAGKPFTAAEQGEREIDP